MRDSYSKFFKDYVTKDQFFDFGLKETIPIPEDKAKKEWELLKERIENDHEVFIRGFGRNASGTYLYKDFYSTVLNKNNVSTDPSNNSKPTKVLKELSCYSKTKSKKYKDIRNYQVSHVFGRTKNIYTFTAPWNIVYTPKMLDPFTGHEAKGDASDEYKKLFQQQAYEWFSDLIEDYNDLIKRLNLEEKINNYCDGLALKNELGDDVIEKFRTSALKELSPIYL